MDDYQNNGHFNFEIGNADLNFESVSTNDPKITGRQIVGYFGGSPADEHLVFELRNSNQLNEIALSDIVNLRPEGDEQFLVFKSSASFRFALDGGVIEWGSSNILGKTMHTLFADHQNNKFVWMALRDEPDRKVELDETINLGTPGLERFYLKVSEWKLNVQGVKVTFAQSKVSVRNAITRAGFDPETGWIAILKIIGKPKQAVSLDDLIDLSAPGIEKLRLTPKEINNGEVMPDLRKQFALLPTDDRFLSNRSFVWETLLDGGRRWFILRGFPVPQGYDQTLVDIAIDIPPNYPTAQLDMFYCYPHLTKVTGQPIPTTESRQAIEGRSYQRWSRHRGGSNPWKPQFDSLVSQLILAEEAIQREVIR